MNLKKILPVLLLFVMAVIAISIRRCNSNSSSNSTNNNYRRTQNTQAPPSSTRRNQAENNTRVNTKTGLDRNATNLYFTKHAKCRMKCRHITQQEVKDILSDGDINYNKSDLQDPRGATYAVEGKTRDGQRVRIIFAPKNAHLTVVTVIDLEVEYECHCA